MPSVLNDIDTLLKNINLYFKYLPVKNIYVIAPENVSARLEQENDNRIIFVNENKFVDVKRIRALYSSRTDKNSTRVGWYVQQFIKLQFSRFTRDEYYLIWDGDTIPLKNIKLFDDGKRPFFDVRDIIIPPYYDTLAKLFPDVKLSKQKSFVTEHMIIKSEYMREMLNEIENNNDIAGNNFQEKIINAVNIDDLDNVGFSEYETYGNFVMSTYPESYSIRQWKSLRAGIRFYDNAESLDDEQIKWLAKNYYAVSIEKWQKKTILASLVKIKAFRKIFSPIVLEKIPYTFRGLIGKFIPAKYKPAIKKFLRIES